MPSTGTRHVNESNLTKIAHVSSVHPWSDNRIHLREAATLAAAGYEVTLVAVENDVDVLDTGLRVVRLSKSPRITRVVLATFLAVREGLRSGATVFHLHDPELVWAIPMLRLSGKKVIYDAHEDLPAQVLNKHYVNGLARPLFVLVAHLVVALSRQSNHVITATEKIAERYHPARVTVVHNYPRLRQSDVGAPPASERGRSAVYVGGLGEERGAVQMIDALAEADFPPGWKLEIAGTVPQESLLERLRSLPGWANVSFHGRVSPERARDLVGQSRVGLVVFQRTTAHLDALPTKMFEYFAAGIPVVASDFPLWRSIIEQHQCGLLVDETSPAAIAAAISQYANDPELLDRHGENARLAADSMLNWANEEPILLDVYARVAQP